MLVQIPLQKPPLVKGEMLFQGVTLQPSQTKYLLLRTRKAGSRGDPAESYLAHTRVQEHGLLTLTAGADGEKAEGILGHLSDAMFPLLLPPSCLSSCEHGYLCFCSLFSPVSAGDTAPLMSMMCTYSLQICLSPFARFVWYQRKRVREGKGIQTEGTIAKSCCHVLPKLQLHEQMQGRRRLSRSLRSFYSWCPRSHVDASGPEYLLWSHYLSLGSCWGRRKECTYPPWQPGVVTALGEMVRCRLAMSYLEDNEAESSGRSGHGARLQD